MNFGCPVRLVAKSDREKKHTGMRACLAWQPLGSAWPGQVSVSLF